MDFAWIYLAPFLFFSVVTFGEKGAIPGTLMKNTNQMVNFSCLKKGSSKTLKTAQFEIIEGKAPRNLDENYKTAVIHAMEHILNVSQDSSHFKKPIIVEQIRGGRSGKCYNFSPGGRKIQLVSGCGSATKEPYKYAVRHFIHEMGHLIGQQGHYASYMKAVKKPCMLSSYGVNNTNQRPRQEEFAEVFRGILFDENEVKSAGGTCADAAEFFKKLLKLKSPQCPGVK